MAFSIAAMFAGAVIAAAVDVSTRTGLVFGAIVPAEINGEVAVSPAGSRSCTSVTCLPQTSVSAAWLDVMGDPQMSYGITLPPSAMLTDGAGHSMSVVRFEDSENGSGALDASGNGSFTVGATLQVGAAQPAGEYSGSFDILVEYQ